LAAAIDRKRNEQALRRSEVRYRSLVQTAVYGIYRSSLEGRFIDVNPALIGMLGYNSALEVLALDPQKTFSSSLASTPAWSTNSAAPDAWTASKPAGVARTAKPSPSASADAPVASGDEPSEVLEAIAEDITERRVLEDQFRRPRKWKPSAASRRHRSRLHNLLMVISGYTEVLLDQLAPDHPLHTKAEAIRPGLRPALPL